MFGHAVGLCPQVCVGVCGRKRKDETAGRAIHLFFLVEALSVTVGYAEASRVEHIVDL